MEACVVEYTAVCTDDEGTTALALRELMFDEYGWRQCWSDDSK